MNVVIIDYGAGNVPSVAAALRRLGVEATTTKQAAELARADRIILPGVGHCAALTHALDAQGIRKPLVDAISRSVPFLGICLGYRHCMRRATKRRIWQDWVYSRGASRICLRT